MRGMSNWFCNDSKVLIGTIQQAVLHYRQAKQVLSNGKERYAFLLLLDMLFYYSSPMSILKTG